MDPKEASCGLHTQEVAGSSPAAPTIQFKGIQTEGYRAGCICDVDCDVTAQFTFPTAG